MDSDGSPPAEGPLSAAEASGAPAGLRPDAGAATCLDNIETVEELVAAVAAGRLPQVRARGVSPAGEWA
eukprot:5949395-Pyramimonas_sp.AAC.1